MGQVLLNVFNNVQKLNGIVIMFFNAGGDGENIGVKNNIFCWKAHFINQNPIGTLTNLKLAFSGISLTYFVKRHHDDGSAIAAHELGMFNKLINAFFHRNRVNNALALNAF